MREWIIDKHEYEYECPYCHTQIADYTLDESDLKEGYEIEYCGRCTKEFKLVRI